MKNITAMSAEKIEVKLNRQSLTPVALSARSAVILNYKEHLILKPCIAVFFYPASKPNNS